MSVSSIVNNIDPSLIEVLVYDAYLRYDFNRNGYLLPVEVPFPKGADPDSARFSLSTSDNINLPNYSGWESVSKSSPLYAVFDLSWETHKTDHSLLVDWVGDGSFVQTILVRLVDFTFAPENEALLYSGDSFQNITSVNSDIVFMVAETSGMFTQNKTPDISARVTSTTSQVSPDPSGIFTGNYGWVELSLVPPDNFSSSTVAVYSSSDCNDNRTRMSKIPLSSDGFLHLFAPVTSTLNLNTRFLVDWNDDGTNFQTVYVYVPASSLVELRPDEVSFNIDAPVVNFQSLTGSGVVTVLGAELYPSMEVRWTDAKLPLIQANPNLGQKSDFYSVSFEISPPDDTDFDKSTYTWDSVVSKVAGTTTFSLAVLPDNSRSYQLTFNWTLVSGDQITQNFNFEFELPPTSFLIPPSHLVEQDTKVANISVATGTSTVRTTGNIDLPDIDVFIDKATIKFSEADPSIGRNDAGYWIGVNVYTPKGVDKSLAKVNVYQDYKNPTSFKSYNWVDVLDTPDYCGFWALTPTSGDFGRRLVFDWNGDGSLIQNIAFHSDTENLVLLPTGTEYVSSGSSYQNYYVVSGDSLVTISADTSPVEYPDIRSTVISGIIPYNEDTSSWVVEHRLYLPKDVESSKIRLSSTEELYPESSTWVSPTLLSDTDGTYITLQVHITDSEYMGSRHWLVDWTGDMDDFQHVFISVDASVLDLASIESGDLQPPTGDILAMFATFPGKKRYQPPIEEDKPYSPSEELFTLIPRVEVFVGSPNSSRFVWETPSDKSDYPVLGFTMQSYTGLREPVYIDVSTSAIVT